ncbi:GSCFA domain-containing protein [Paracoccus sp. DMF-8]|uniref:GSCFA domain-containing protein n=1 Tax=Paracoccus sp. DMF-8 TaxID=3019445 RepID=UPI0023E7E9E2|nr:GSCFA domain-containing protein [Paracoccus sp. DMF-8]MDF3607027.1 GSCFA domain-containing protein [Paracoccus sp. DMF-8]
MNIPALGAFQRALKSRGTSRFPNKADSRDQDGLLFPSVTPSFHLVPGQRIFTIGSCFARNVEDFLTDFDVPTRRFSVQKSEWASRPNGLLNEYNAGTIAQRMIWAVEGRPTADMPGTLIGPEDDTLDLLLPTAPGVRARVRWHGARKSTRFMPNCRAAGW